MKKIVYVVFSENTAYGETTHDIAVFEKKEDAMERYNALAERVRGIGRAESLALGGSEYFTEAYLEDDYNTNHCFVSMTEKELN